MKTVALRALRVLMGFLVAPAVPALILYLIYLIFIDQRESAFGAKFFAFLGYWAALMIGVPVYFFLRWRKITKLKVYLAWGALIGLIFYWLFFGITVLDKWGYYPEYAIVHLKEFIQSSIFIAMYGSIASLAFWFIAIKRVD